MRQIPVCSGCCMLCVWSSSLFFSLEIQCHLPITIFHKNIHLLVSKPWLTGNTALTNFPVREKYYVFLGNSYLFHHLKGGLAAWWNIGSQYSLDNGGQLPQACKKISPYDSELTWTLDIFYSNVWISWDFSATGNLLNKLTKLPLQLWTGRLLLFFIWVCN